MLNDGASAVGKLHLNLSMETHRVAWEDVHDSLHRAVHVFKDYDMQVAPPPLAYSASLPNSDKTQLDGARVRNRILMI
eukprot:6199962-Amphidinium_carterae.1